MGESRRRKLTEPGYGKRPKGGRGIMLVPMFRQEGNGPEVFTGVSLSAEQLRFGLCFWDRIAWPYSRFLPTEDNAEVAFLHSAGLLLRPEMQLRPNLMSAGKGLAESYLHAFQELEEKEPGVWSLSTETEFDVKAFLHDRISPDRSITVSLHRAVPVPTGDAPLHDLLEFKQKRDPELLALRYELDRCKQLITSSTDRAEAFSTQRDRIDAACGDLLAVSRENRLPVRISDVSFALETAPQNLVALAAATASLADHMNLTGVQTFLASVGLIVIPGLKVTTTFGTKNKNGKLRTSPFRYVHHLHEEIDWR